MTLPRIFSFMALSILAALLWWLENIVQSTQEANLRTAHNRPDFFMREFTMTDYDVAGKKRHVVTGNSVLHYPKDSNLEIRKLNLVSDKGDNRQIFVKANRARISNDGNHIYLDDKVQIDQKAPGDTMAFRSESLFLDNEKDYLESNSDITITTDKHHIRGTGLQAWLKHRKIRILSKARGKHEP